jgi:hypothetical protein
MSGPRLRSSRRDGHLRIRHESYKTLPRQLDLSAAKDPASSHQPRSSIASSPKCSHARYISRRTPSPQNHHPERAHSKNPHRHRQEIHLPTVSRYLPQILSSSRSCARRPSGLDISAGDPAVTARPVADGKVRERTLLDLVVNLLIRSRTSHRVAGTMPALGPRLALLSQNQPQIGPLDPLLVILRLN